VAGSDLDLIRAELTPVFRDRLQNAGACGESSGAISRQCREQQDQERGQ
jgi:hypothetical protein